MKRKDPQQSAPILQNFQVFLQSDYANGTLLLIATLAGNRLLIFEKSMSHLVDPSEASAEQASFQSFFGRTSSSNRIEDIGLQFLAIVRSRSCRVFGCLGPNELCRI